MGLLDYLETGSWQVANQRDKERKALKNLEKIAKNSSKPTQVIIVNQQAPAAPVSQPAPAAPVQNTNYSSSTSYTTPKEDRAYEFIITANEIYDELHSAAKDPIYNLSPAEKKIINTYKNLWDIDSENILKGGSFSTAAKYMQTVLSCADVFFKSKNKILAKELFRRARNIFISGGVGNYKQNPYSLKQNHLGLSLTTAVQQTLINKAHEDLLAYDEIVHKQLNDEKYMFNDKHRTGFNYYNYLQTWNGLNGIINSKSDYNHFKYIVMEEAFDLMRNSYTYMAGNKDIIGICTAKERKPVKAIIKKPYIAAIKSIEKAIKAIKK